MPTLTPFLISIATFCFTFMGGSFALKFKDKLHLILGFSAGAVLAVAFFDLLPEALELGGGTYSIPLLTSIVALGFVFYMVLDRAITLHSDQEGGGHVHRGKLGAASLSFHSFLDGLAIGIAFQVSSSVGMIVAIAVLVHDFSDGINTVNFILKGHGTKQSAIRWLLVDAAAPVIGMASTLFFTLSESTLGIILALFCGFFTYIGASDLLPESHHAHPTKWTTFATLFGMAVMYLAIRFAGA